MPFSPKSQDSLHEPQGLCAVVEQKEKLRPQDSCSGSSVAVRLWKSGFRTPKAVLAPSDCLPLLCG